MSDELVGTLRSFNIFFDIEASCLGDGTYPIEVGIVGEGLSYEALIKPHADWVAWSSQSQKIHGISKKKLEKEGKSIEDVCHEINKMFKGKTIWSDSKFDPFWLEILFDKAKIEMQFVSKNVTFIIDKTLIAKLAFELPQGDRVVHRALADAEDLRDAWARVCNWVEKHQTIPEQKAE